MKRYAKQKDNSIKIKENKDICYVVVRKFSIILKQDASLLPICFPEVILESLFKSRFYVTSHSALPQNFLMNSIFYELKGIVLKQKIVQNYKTSWNSSKFIDIYNIVIELDTRTGISCQ